MTKNSTSPPNSIDTNAHSSQGIFLSEATWEVEPQLNHINLINAPMACGKTTFTNNLPGSADSKTVLLVPLQTLHSQVGADSGKFISAYSTLDTQWVFGDEVAPGGYTHLVYTTQYFMTKLNDKAFLSSIGCICIDEFDWVFLDMLKWSGSKSIATTNNFLQWLAANCDTKLVIGLSATGMEESYSHVQRLTGKARLLRTHQPLRQLPRTQHTIPNARTYLAKYPTTPVAIYATTVAECKRLKVVAEKLGRTVALICSMQAKSYTMNEFDLAVRESIIQSATVPPEVEVLIFNDAMQRGVNIKHSNIANIILCGDEPRGNIQASGRFRYQVVEWIPSGWNEAHMWEIFGDGFCIPTNARRFYAVDIFGWPSWKTLRADLEIEMEIVQRKGFVEICRKTDTSLTQEIKTPETAYRQAYGDWWRLDELCGEFGVVGAVQLEQFCKANGWSLVKGRIRENGKQIQRYRIDNVNGIVAVAIENNNISHCITLEDNVWYSEEELLKICDTTTLTSALLKLQDFNIAVQKGTPRINGKRARRYKKA